MILPAYKIELRQIEVRGLNARHYFWVLKKRQPDGRFGVVRELHGAPADPKTGEMKSFSLGGDRLKFFNFPGDKFHKQSHNLPFAIATQGSKEKVLARWAEGIRAGKLVNKTGTKYSLWDTNSNAVANSLGNWMGFDVQRISDTRTDAAQPFVPGIGTDLLAGSPARETQQSPFIENRESVGLNSLVRDADGNEPEPAPFRDPFRTDIPF